MQRKRQTRVPARAHIKHPGLEIERAAKASEPPKPVTRPLPDDSAARKTYPMATGLLDYFPAALAEVAHISYLGNQKHNPGQELHWSRGKSNDHADCAIRHLAERGTRDDNGVRHTAQAAWRALAELQEELEREGAPLARGARLPSR